VVPAPTLQAAGRPWGTLRLTLLTAGAAAALPSALEMCQHTWLRALRRPIPTRPAPPASPVDVPAHVAAQVILHTLLHQVVRLLLAVQAVEQQALRWEERWRQGRGEGDVLWGP